MDIAWKESRRLSIIFSSVISESMEKRPLVRRTKQLSKVVFTSNLLVKSAAHISIPGQSGDARSNKALLRSLGIKLRSIYLIQKTG